MVKQLQSELFKEWRSECELIDKEMSRIASARLSGSGDERQVRKFQFASLVERRNEAARKLLGSRGVIRRVRASD
jgi:integration host factor subunit alpha